MNGRNGVNKMGEGKRKRGSQIKLNVGLMRGNGDFDNVIK